MESRWDAPLGARPELWLPEVGTVRVTVRGDSMVPNLREGEQVEVRAAARGVLEPGDLVVFPRAGELTVHRLIARREEGFLEMGDGQGRGNWQPWPPALGLAVVLLRTGSPLFDLRTPEARRSAALLARRLRRRHRAVRLAEALPGELLGRIVLGMLRPVLY